MVKTTKKKVSAGTAVAIGAGVAALGAISYYFFGPHGKRHRQAFTGWMIKMKGEIVERLERASEVTEAAYRSIVDSVAAAYAQTGISKKEVLQYAEQLKRQWKGIVASAKKQATVRAKKARSRPKKTPQKSRT